jgi:hypothetical protein
MSVSNLSIVFGPTLLGAPPEEGGLNLEHMSFQCKVSVVDRKMRREMWLNIPGNRDDIGEIQRDLRRRRRHVGR